MILEFNGLAGCGKSTLCEKLQAGFVQDGVPVIYIDEKPIHSVFDHFNRLQIHRYVQILSLPTALNCTRLLARTRLFSEVKRFVKLYELIACYKYIEHHKGNTVVVCDEGIIQSMVSIWGYDSERIFTPREKAAIRHFLRSCPDTYSFYCKLDVPEVVRRIRKRGRNHGRLNLIRDDGELSAKLNNNLLTLEQIVSIEGELRAERTLDMRQGADALAEAVRRCVFEDHQ